MRFGFDGGSNFRYYWILEFIAFRGTVCMVEYGLSHLNRCMFCEVQCLLYLVVVKCEYCSSDPSYLVVCGSVR